MSGRYIEESVRRRLYAESMGRCMNPSCQQELFRHNGDIVEKAHIDPYCETADNSFENLVLLCPNCHTDFDKNHAFTAEQVLGWKKARGEELKRFFGKQYPSFEELKKVVVPLLLENQTIFENYYLKNRVLWDKSEGRILANNRMLKELFSANWALFQKHADDDFSNGAYVRRFMAHVDEFEATRSDDEKCREILFPQEISSMFGIAPVEDTLLPSTESLELLIDRLKAQGKFLSITLGLPRPYITLKENDEEVQVYLDDTPRVRQLYHDYRCFRAAKVQLKSLNYAMRVIRSRKISYDYLCDSNLREITIQGTKVTFIYEYCLSEAQLMDLLPDANSVIVNLHNWNGVGCISKQAYALADSMNVTLLTTEAFYAYINRLPK